MLFIDIFIQIWYTKSVKIQQVTASDSYGCRKDYNEKGRK